MCSECIASKYGSAKPNSSGDFSNRVLRYVSTSEHSKPAEGFQGAPPPRSPLRLPSFPRRRRRVPSARPAVRASLRARQARVSGNGPLALFCRVKLFGRKPSGAMLFRWTPVGATTGSDWGPLVARAAGSPGAFEATICQFFIRRPPAIRKARVQFLARGHCARSGNWDGLMQLSPQVQKSSTAITRHTEDLGAGERCAHSGAWAGSIGSRLVCFASQRCSNGLRRSDRGAALEPSTGD